MPPERLPTPRYCQLCGHHLLERYIPSEGRTRWQCEGCGHIPYLNPRVVASVIVEYDARVLLKQPAMEPRAGYWTFPAAFWKWARPRSRARSAAKPIT